MRAWALGSQSGGSAVGVGGVVHSGRDARHHHGSRKKAGGSVRACVCPGQRGIARSAAHPLPDRMAPRVDEELRHVATRQGGCLRGTTTPAGPRGARVGERVARGREREVGGWETWPLRVAVGAGDAALAVLTERTASDQRGSICLSGHPAALPMLMLRTLYFASLARGFHLCTELFQNLILQPL